MPIYEYECRKCKHRFERLLKSAGDAPDKCPRCGASSIEKVFSSFSVSQPVPSSAGSACSACPSSGCPHRH